MSNQLNTKIMANKTLMEYLAESDYSALLRFVHSTATNGIDDKDAADFYRDAPEDWKQTVLNSCAPGPEAEKAIVLYGSDETVHLLRVRHGFYPQTLLWALNEGTPEAAMRVVKALKNKPSSEVEVAMLKRGESELFKLWIEKFHYLDEEAEKLINEDARLWSLKNTYIDYQTSRGK